MSSLTYDKVKSFERIAEGEEWDGVEWIRIFTIAHGEELSTTDAGGLLASGSVLPAAYGGPRTTNPDDPRLQTWTRTQQTDSKNVAGNSGLDVITAIYRQIVVTEATRKGTYVETAKSPVQKDFGIHLGTFRKGMQDYRKWTTFGLSTVANDANSPQEGNVRAFGIYTAYVSTREEFPEWQMGRILIKTEWRAWIPVATKTQGGTTFLKKPRQEYGQDRLKAKGLQEWTCRHTATVEPDFAAAFPMYSPFSNRAMTLSGGNYTAPNTTFSGSGVLPVVGQILFVAGLGLMVVAVSGTADSFIITVAGDWHTLSGAATVADPFGAVLVDRTLTEAPWSGEDEIELIYGTYPYGTLQRSQNVLMGSYEERGEPSTIDKLSGALLGKSFSSGGKTYRYTVLQGSFFTIARTTVRILSIELPTITASLLANLEATRGCCNNAPWQGKAAYMVRMSKYDTRQMNLAVQRYRMDVYFEIWTPDAVAVTASEYGALPGRVNWQTTAIIGLDQWDSDQGLWLPADTPTVKAFCDTDAASFDWLNQYIIPNP
jgi:hypothetical protein